MTTFHEPTNMTRKLASPLPDSVTTPQRLASDPRGSAWVRANAGSGKTHVLTERVMRLLLSGVRPEEILCLTYTKAAAAEMRRRVSLRLADWALLPEDDLAARLFALEQRAPSAETLARARTLFAHALDTPGGLKINTIHAFCESVLHRFPLEAGVPFDFSVIEEIEAAALIQQTREAVIAEGLRGASEISGAVETLFALLSDHAMTLAIAAALAEGRKLRHVLADRAGAKRRLRQLVGIPDGETTETVLREAATGMLFPPSRHEALFAYLAPDPAKSRNLRFVDTLWQYRTQMHDGETRFDVFLKGKPDLGDPYSDRRIAKIKDASLAAEIGGEHDRLAALYPRFRRATLVERSEALLDLLAAISERYEARKRVRSLLDFDDLIERLGELFARREAADWVRYKLDAGITHILVDESQDTNPEQWRVVDELSREFFAGDGAVERPRTIFAVGDEKQSIFSFQGAEPSLFGDLGRRFEAQSTSAGERFTPVRLKTSFRTLPGILQAVDLVFRDPLLEAGVLAKDEPVLHETARAEAGGRVTLWPTVKEGNVETDAEIWPRTPEDMPRQLQRAPRRLAERIAGEIRGWLDNGRPLGPRGRSVVAEDILILVQTRSSLFSEIIRALGQAGIRTPGADRLPVTEHIAVLDLLALGDVLTNTGDNLQLAALLRSPLFDVTEDELFAIAADRPKRQTLWSALEGSSLPAAQEAFARLKRWRGRLDFGRPFELYSEVLYRDQGLRRFHGRLGGEVDDVIVEFLDLALKHEQGASASLQSFLAEMRAQDISIKRDLAEPGNGVRVMTVHGAKGLEAPIVILADAASRPAPSLFPPVIIASDATGPMLVHAPSKAVHTAETKKFREALEAASDAEYWRKLYVGMTRAEDELYITGALTKTGKVEGSWYAAVERGLGPVAERLESAEGEVTLSYPPPGDMAASVAFGTAAPSLRLAPVVLPPLAVPTITEIVRPSSAGPKTGKPPATFATAIEMIRTAEQSRQNGIALHALLQHLSRAAPADQAALAAGAMPELLPDASAVEREVLATKALSLLSRQEFAQLFGPNSRAEVPFMVDAYRNGIPVRLAGRIDRMVVANGEVTVVDYKSDANPPGTVSEVPASYVTQVGLYAYVASQLFPKLVVRTGILWTSMESLMILPPDMLRDAASAFTIR
jgi:ATP-dependent helicase/nuclease subunit A